MHLREARQRRGKRDLRYLHAMYALPDRKEIEGVMSGPGVYWHYRLIQTRYGTQLNVLHEHGSPKDLERIGARFLIEVLRRVRMEQSGAQHHPVRTAGQFYLKRRLPGMAATHRTCQRAIASGVLEKAFVSKLSAWDLELLCPT
jgi:hypothetical protein